MLDKLVIADDKYPSVPRPSSELISCGVEMMLDKLVTADDKYPSVPKPLVVLIKFSVDTSPPPPC